MTTPAAGFRALGVPASLVDVLTRLGITEPFPIQRASIPDGLAGRDVLGRAPTGSGKTIAFGVPLLAAIERSEPRRPHGLVLSPTRELAEQIRRELDPLAEAVDRRVLAVYGGVAIGPQASALRRGVDVLVACPGRLQDLIERGDVSLDRVNRVVVDEADRMADMGFLPVVRSLLDLTATERQTVLFSATLDRDVQVLVDEHMHDPAEHQVGDVEPDLSAVSHRFIATDKQHKLGLTADLIDDAGPTMVFCRTRHGVDRVARQLKRVGVKAGWIHGGRTQPQRDAALSAFTSGRVQALVATDVAARGIHVDGVACVVHYDPPADAKDYVHRSGRTARAGAGGSVVSLVNSDQVRAVGRLQRDVGLPASDPEPMPALSEREVLQWVDQRPGRGQKRRPRQDATDDRQAPKRRPRQDATDERQAPKRRPRQDATDERQAPKRRPRRERSDERADGDARSTPRRRRPAGATPERTTADGQGTATKRATRKRPTAKQAAGKPKGRKKPSKRSGRPRAKNHKQTRRTGRAPR